MLLKALTMSAFLLSSTVVVIPSLVSSLAQAAPTSADAKAEEARVQAAVAKEKKVLATYSLEELNEAATYLTTVFENSLTPQKSTKVIDCDPTPEKAQLWLSGPLHALVDEKTEEEALTMSKGIERELKKLDKKWRACADQCQCASYIAVVEQIENADRAADSRASTTDREHDSSKKSKVKRLSVPDQNRLKIAAEWLSKENKKISAKSLSTCATRASWFCKSALRSYLDQAAEE